MTDTLDTWPAGATWVFQGTVAEDATGGTHVCSLTVTPGAGNEMQLMYGNIQVGNTATAQTAQAFIDDGTNQIAFVMEANPTSLTTANENYPVPPNGNVAVASLGASTESAGWNPFIISGTMRLIFRVSTAAISVTQTFSVACRIKGAIPTATLADSVGTPVLTTNTNAVF